MSYKSISFEIKNKFAYIGFGYNCDKSMTTLGEQAFEDLQNAITEVEKEQNNLNGLIFFSHKSRCFLAGADINLIASMKTENDGAEGAKLGQQLFNRIEDLKIRTIACVNGVCLGGGLELSLSCNEIIASDDKSTLLGLPEVKLGLIPGFGGTYRLPKKIGLPKALDLILTGKTVNGRKAKKLGLVTEVYAKEYLLNKAVDVLNKGMKKTSFKDSLENMANDNFITKKIIYQKARENVLEKTKGFYQAPLKILDVMEGGSLKGRSSYLDSESSAFGELCVGDQSKNLQHIFFMTETVKKYNGPKSEKTLNDLSRGACLGAGTMGGGIAWLMSNNDMKPIMKDLNSDALELGLKQSSSNYASMLKRRKISTDDFARKQRSIRPQTDFAGFKRVDLVIEAIIENIDIKKKVFSELEKEVREDCVITSNTSSLSVEEMAKALEKPSRFAGLHFFNPVNKMPLVEIITHSQIAPEVIEALHKWCLKVKKTPVIVKDGPGFLVNRILMPYLNEASFLLAEGVSIADLDNACLNFGMPMGPARLMDEVGIDVAEKVAKILHDGLGDRAKANDLSKKMVEKQLLGRKNSKGFYLYDAKGKSTGINPEIEGLLPNSKIKMDEVEIQKRCFLPMINEASIILDEGIVKTAEDVDLGMIFGIGFPPFRGGLLRYADHEGPDRILEAIDNFSKTVDKHRYQASSYLRNLVENKKKFYEISE